MPSPLPRLPIAAGPRRWLLAAGLFLAALLPRAAGLPPARFPLASFSCAVLIAAFVTGWAPAAALAAASATAIFVQLRLPGGMPPGETVAALLIFGALSALVILLTEALRRAGAAAEAALGRAERAVEAQRAMAQEMQHRIANNLQFVAALLRVEAKRVRDGAEAAAALDEARRRLELLARVHRTLYDPQSLERDFGTVIEEVCRDLLDGLGADNLVCRIEAAPVALAADRVTTLSLIVAELLSNALKHAYPDGRAGQLAISLRAAEAGRYALEVRDNGPGLPAEQPAGGLGLRIIRSLAGRIGGQLSMHNDDGMVTRIEFAA